MGSKFGQNESSLMSGPYQEHEKTACWEAERKDPRDLDQFVTAQFDKNQFISLQLQKKNPQNQSNTFQSHPFPPFLTFKKTHPRTSLNHGMYPIPLKCSSRFFNVMLFIQYDIL